VARLPFGYSGEVSFQRLPGCLPWGIQRFDQARLLGQRGGAFFGRCWAGGGSA